MQIKLDTHTHTLASGHAYSTILENAKGAAENGMELCAITDHAPGMHDSADMIYFLNYRRLDPTLCGVEMLYGAELDILDFDGGLSFDQKTIKRMDLCIASFHETMLGIGSRAENTRAYLQVMQTPGVSIIGHPDDKHIPVDYEALVLEAKRVGILLEVNNASLLPWHYRCGGAMENYRTMLRLCEKHGVPISLGSDAHFATGVGRMDLAAALLEELRFPEELVVNTDPPRFKEILSKRK